MRWVPVAWAMAAEDDILLGEPHVGDDAGQAASPLVMPGERAAQLQLVDDAGLDEEFSNTVARWGRWCGHGPSVTSGARKSMNSDFHECLAEGVALFNAGRWYEAHEVWEEAWQPGVRGPPGAAPGAHPGGGGVPQAAGRAGPRGLGRSSPGRSSAWSPCLLPARASTWEPLVSQVRQWREGGELAQPVVAWTRSRRTSDAALRG